MPSGISISALGNFCDDPFAFFFSRTTNTCLISFLLSSSSPRLRFFYPLITLRLISRSNQRCRSTSSVCDRLLQIADTLLDPYRRFLRSFSIDAKGRSVIRCDLLLQALASRWSTFRPPWTQGSRSYWRPAFSERG